MIKYFKYSLLVAATLLPACAGPIGIPNPASVYCADAGGKPLTEKRPDGSEFGICRFENDRECGQWALFRGECPMGGIDVSPYPTDAARFCAITGGTVQVDGNRIECTTKNGRTCEAEIHFINGCR